MVGLILWGISPSQGHYQHRTQPQNKCTQTSMLWVGFEPKIPAFERAKTVHALDRAATVIGWNWRIVVRFSELAWHTQTELKGNHMGRTHVTILVSSHLPIGSYSFSYYCVTVTSANPLPILAVCISMPEGLASMVAGNIASSLVCACWREKDPNS
jgi:hypothetical protein